jgi:proteasome lid subunit RPN8/RPN11
MTRYSGIGALRSRLMKYFGGLLEVYLVESRFEKTGSAVVAWWQRRSRGVLLPVPDPGDTGERHQPDEWPPSLPFRKRPKPYSRAIAWVPSKGRRAHVRDRSQPHELFVAQSVLREVRAHLIGSANSEPYGFLLGHVVYCPWTRAPYVVIDAARRETHDAPHSGDVDSFRRSWASASREARRRRGQIIGWYHQHGVLGLHLSQSDLQLQEEFFPEAWHCALLIVPGQRGVVGGFIQRTGRASLYRKGISGFYELIDLDAKLIDGKKPSVVDWTNYRAEERVEVVPATWPVPSRRPRPTPDVQDDESDEARPETDADGEAETKSEPRSGPPAKRWKKRSTPASKKSAPKAKPTAKVKPARKKKRTSKAKSAAKTKKAKPPGDEQAATAADLSGEFHEAVSALDLEPDEAPAESRPVRPSLDADDGQVAEFLEAIWGPAPFEPEANEASVLELPLYRELMPTEAAEMDATLEGTGILPEVGTRDGALGAEPPEADSAAGSLEWLLGLVEQTLAEGLAPTERTDSEAAEQSAEIAADEVETPDAGGDEDAPPPGDPSEPVQVMMPASEAKTAAPPTGRQPRSAFVGVSEDPDEDRLAEIPVVMPTEDGLGWFPSLRRKRDRALIAAAMVIAAVSAWFLLGREQPPQPAFQTPATVAPPTVRPPAQAPEFIRLSGEFTAALAAYKEREADFQLGRIDCTGLATGYEVLSAAFGELSQHVALAPAGSVDFRPFADDMREVRNQFEGSGCERTQGQAGGSA